MSGERIGIIGGGQLGRMLTQAAKPLGFEVTVLDPTVREANKGVFVPDSPALKVGAEQIVADLYEPDAIRRLAERSSVVTWEIEHIDNKTLLMLDDEGVNIEPSPFTLSLIQDKFLQKKYLESRGIPVAPFSLINDRFDLDRFMADHPDVVIKARTGSFDGRGNMRLKTPDWLELIARFDDTPVYAEAAIPFDCELSVIGARDKKGTVDLYPPVETVHKDDICDVVMAPANIDIPTSLQANLVARDTLALLEGAGVFAIEMFVRDGEVMVNEIAPRVHNSGHLTIEASPTSQFEQHIRAISGLALGNTLIRRPVAMANILYGPITFEGIKRATAVPDTHLHLYDKQPRPGQPRKIGHITAFDGDVNRAVNKAIKARKELENG